MFTTAEWVPTWWFWVLVALVAVLLTLILAGIVSLITYYCFFSRGRQTESLTRIELHSNSPVYAVGIMSLSFFLKDRTSIYI